MQPHEFYKFMKIFLIFIGMLGLLLSSCSHDDDYMGSVRKDNLLETDDGVKMINPAYKEKYLVEFADILSKAVYDSEDVREFIKRESLKQFDKNYDVLYYLVKDENIGEKTFRDILISYSSIEDIEEIETNVPLLNIFVSKIAFFDIHPENLNHCRPIKTDFDSSLLLTGLLSVVSFYNFSIFKSKPP